MISRGSPLKRASKTITFDGTASLGLVGLGNVFLITGEVSVEKLVPTCVTTLAAGGSGAGTPSIQLGVAGATTLFVASTVPSAIIAGKFWTTATPAANGVAIPAALKEVAVTDHIQFQVTSTQADVAQVDTLLFPTLAGAADGDYVVITTKSGTTYAAAFDKTGSSAAPTGAAWLAVAIGHRVQVDTHLNVTAAQDATSFKTALNAISGFTAEVTASDAAADGHLSLTQLVVGSCPNPVPHTKNDSGAGSISTAATTPGIDAYDKKPVASGVVRFDMYWMPLSSDGAVA